MNVFQEEKKNNPCVGLQSITILKFLINNQEVKDQEAILTLKE